MTAGEVLRTALGLEQSPGGLPVAAVEADGWLGDLLAGADDRRLRACRRPTASPASCARTRSAGSGGSPSSVTSVSGPAWPTTWDSARQPSSWRCWSTSAPVQPRRQLASALDHSQADGNIPRAAGPTLVLCPMSLVGNWQREAARFAPNLSVYVHHGPDRLDGNAFTRHATKVDLVLSTYGLAARDQQLWPRCRGDGSSLDEAQQIKNSAARTTQSVRAIPAERQIAMTGTPVENRLSELWSIMQFLNPGMLGSEKAFRERFAIPIERDGDDEAAARLRRITGPFVLRRLKTRPVDHRRPARQARDEGVLHPDPRAGHPLPGRRRRHAGPDRRGRGHRTPWARPRHHDEAQAGVQPPRPFPGRRIVGRGSVGQAVTPRRGARGGGGRGRPLPRLHPVHRDGRHAGTPSPPAAGLRGPVAPRRGAQEEARRDGRAVPGCRPARRYSCSR